MKITIRKRVYVKEEIDIEFPYYYEHDLLPDYGDSIIYGVITETGCFNIHERENIDGSFVYELSNEDIDDSYYSDEYKSTKKEFVRALERAMKFLTANDTLNRIR